MTHIALLSGESGITLVERQSLMETLREHELNLTGLVDDGQAVKIGKPVVTVIIREQHHAATPVLVLQAIDPAVETEVKKLLIECGFTVQEVPQNVSTDLRQQWTVVEHARDWPTDLYRRWTVVDDRDWPRTADKVEVLIAGEAFSEFAARSATS